MAQQRLHYLVQTRLLSNSEERRWQANNTLHLPVLKRHQRRGQSDPTRDIPATIRPLLACRLPQNHRHTEVLAQENPAAHHQRMARLTAETATAGAAAL